MTRATMHTLSPNNRPRCTIKVLALAMSMPDSMMAVHASTSYSAFTNAAIMALELSFLHLAVRHAHAGVRKSAPARDPPSLSCGHAVVHEVNLNSPAQFGFQGIAHDVSDPRNDARSMAGGLRGGVAMMERSRVPSSDMCKVRGMAWPTAPAVHVRAHLLEPLLLLDSEFLFLIHDEQARSLKSRL